MRPEDVFWALHDGLPRQAPGSAASTSRLLSLADVRPGSRVLEVGAGPGTTALLLARSGMRVTAVDIHRPFLRQVVAAAAEAGLTPAVSAVHAAMENLPVRDGSVDLVWAEASVYVMGFDRALTAWRRLLAPQGAIVLTECELTALDVPEPVRQYWAATYPAIRTTAGNVEAALRLGYRVDGLYLLPDRDWWDEYYHQIEWRAAEIRAGAHGADPTVAAAIDAHLREVALRRAHPRAYGYTGYVLRPS